MNILNWYSKLLLEKPYSTKMITSFITFGLGDVISQTIEKNAKKKKGEKSFFNFVRFIKQATFGVLITPYLHLHFAKIVPFVVPQNPNSNPKTIILKRLLYDQTVHATAFTVVYFLWLNMVNHTGFNKAVKNMSELLVPTMIANWKVWPAVMLINFSIMPQHFSVLYVNVVAIFWNAYISYVFNKNKM